MTARATLATAHRVLRQLRRDPRTLALLFGVPVVLLAMVRWVFDAQPGMFQRLGVPLLGIFPLISMFVVTSITMLRERTTGTLERLMTLPLSKLDLLAGYALAFSLFAAIQTLLVATIALTVLDLHVSAPLWVVLAIAVLNALHGMSFGLFLSAFAHTEFQAAQFMPAFMLPEFLLCGLLGPRSQMARPLEIVSDYLPMTYAYDALAHVASSDALTGGLACDAGVVAVTTLIALALGAATLRRRTA